MFDFEKGFQLDHYLQSLSLKNGHFHYSTISDHFLDADNPFPHQSSFSQNLIYNIYLNKFTFLKFNDQIKKDWFSDQSPW